MSTPIDINPPEWNWDTINEVHRGFSDFCIYQQTWVSPTVDDLLDLIQGVGHLFQCHGKDWPPKTAKSTMQWVWNNYAETWNTEDPDRASTQPYRARYPSGLFAWDVAMKAGFHKEPTTGKNIYLTGGGCIPLFVEIIHRSLRDWRETLHGGFGGFREEIAREEKEREANLLKKRTGA